MRNEELGIRNEGGGFAANIYGAMPEGRRIEVRSLKSDISPHIVISSEARNLCHSRSGG